MAKRCALLLAGLGYLMVIWFFVVSPNGRTLKVLSAVCPACPIVESIGPTWPLYVLVFAPINAGMYAAAGFLAGRIILKVRNRVPATTGQVPLKQKSGGAGENRTHV